MRKVLLLGASGSIGGQSLDILEKERGLFELVAFSVGLQISKIPSILARFPSVKSFCVQNESDAIVLKEAFPDLKIYAGEEGLMALVQETDCDLVENALVGFVGLMPSIAALKRKRILALANKESLVVAGKEINRLLSQGFGQLYPIDSEHVGLAKCLAKVERSEVKKLIITASGGALRKLSRNELTKVRKEEALKHPTWSMGAKITIDSATMFNKGFEVIEAHHLFNWPLEDIEALLHDESEVHALLLLKDGSYVADISKPDMHGPIAYALHEGQLDYAVYHEKKLSDFGRFTFHKFKDERYPAVGIAVEAQRMGGIMPAVLNASNEEAVRLFLEDKIGFLTIEKAVMSALNHIPNKNNPTLRDIKAADFYARLYVRRKFGGA